MPIPTRAPVLETARDRHLFAPGPKRILSLDGGGVLGVIEIAFLEKIEALLRGRTRKPDLVLADYFDLIGGTSTGAIIATALALGFTAEQLRKHYFDFAPAIFRKPVLSLPVIGPRFNASGLANKLRGVLGERQLQSEDLKTGLAILTKRVDTGSVWVLTNNPRSKYWEDPAPDPKTGKPPYVGNKRYKLRELVRASTAAPYYFNPKAMPIVEGEPPGLFVDGGVSPHNNPALQMLMLAGIRGYGLQWPLGRDNLLLISIGTGWLRPRIARDALSPRFAANALRSVVWDCQLNTLKLLQWMSTPRSPWTINTEVGTLAGERLGGVAAEKALLTFARYDIAFEPGWVKEQLGLNRSQKELESLNDFTNPKVMDGSYELAALAARKQVDEADFPRVFDVRG